MDLILSLFTRELLTQPRRKSFYIRRLAWIGVAAAIPLWGNWIMSLAQSTTMGLSIFRLLSSFAVVGMFVIPLYTSAALVLRERTERTLGLLFMTDLRGWQIVTGKFLTALFYSLSYTLGVMPLIILTASLGGIAASQILYTFVLLFGILFLGTCVGMFAGTVAASENRMSRVLFFVAILLFALIPEAAVRGYCRLTHSIHLDTLLNISSPIHALRDMTNAINMHHSLYNCLYNMLLGLPFLIATYILLPKKAISKEKLSIKQTLIEKMREHARLKNLIRRPKLKGNPVAWRELTFTYGGGQNRASRMFVMILGGLTLVLMGVLLATGYDRNMAQGLAMNFGILCLTIFILSTVTQASGAFYGDRTNRTLEVLLTTSLSERDIVIGKGLAIYKASLPWMIGTLSGAAMWFLATLPDVYAWIVWIVLAALLSVWFSFCSMAMWLSIKFKRAAALTISVVVFIAWSVFGQAVLVPIALIAMVGGAGASSFGGEEVGVVVGTAIAALLYVGLHVGLGAVFILLLTRTLRLVAIGSPGQ
jgi:ABC-type transport system involved in multi-copper enzyme maturation permease subunit